MRAISLAPLLLAVGCTWPWGQLGVQDGGPDAGARDGGAPTDAAGHDGGDAGRLDAGSDEDAGPPRDGGPPGVDAGPSPCPVAPFTELCAASQVCARPEGPGARCCVPGRCLTAPVLGWARRTSWTGPNQAQVGAEPEWATAGAFPLTSFTGSVAAEPAPSAPDLSATWGALFNDQALYLLIDVNDDAHDFGGGAWDSHDAVEVQVDIDPGQPGPPDATVSPDEDRVAKPASAAGLVSLGPRAWPGTSAAALPDPPTDDWAVEVWIRWDGALGAAAPREGDLIGVEIVVHDVDVAGETADRWSWTPCDDGAALASGLVRLIGEAAPTPACPGRCASSACPGPGYACDRATPLSCDP